MQCRYLLSEDSVVITILLVTKNDQENLCVSHFLTSFLTEPIYTLLILSVNISKLIELACGGVKYTLTRYNLFIFRNVPAKQQTQLILNKL